MKFIILLFALIQITVAANRALIIDYLYYGCNLNCYIALNQENTCGAHDNDVSDQQYHSCLCMNCNCFSSNVYYVSESICSMATASSEFETYDGGPSTMNVSTTDYSSSTEDISFTEDVSFTADDSFTEYTSFTKYSLSVSSFTKVIWSTLETSSIKGIAATTSSYFTNSQTTSGTANDSSISKPSGTQIFVLCVISVVGFIFFFLFFLSLFV